VTPAILLALSIGVRTQMWDHDMTVLCIGTMVDVGEINTENNIWCWRTDPLNTASSPFCAAIPPGLKIYMLPMWARETVPSSQPVEFKLCRHDPPLSNGQPGATNCPETPWTTELGPTCVARPADEILAHPDWGGCDPAIWGE